MLLPSIIIALAFNFHILTDLTLDRDPKLGEGLLSPLTWPWRQSHICSLNKLGIIWPLHLVLALGSWVMKPCWPSSKSKCSSISFVHDAHGNSTSNATKSVPPLPTGSWDGLRITLFFYPLFFELFLHFRHVAIIYSHDVPLVILQLHSGVVITPIQIVTT